MRNTYAQNVCLSDSRKLVLTPKKYILPSPMFTRWKTAKKKASECQVPATTYKTDEANQKRYAAFSLKS